MDGFPIELIRLIFDYCDRVSVRNLRLASGTLAQVGYDFLIPPRFTAVGWRDDVHRLHSIACHERLRSSVEAVTINFAEVDEYNARHASYFQHYFPEPEERSAVRRDAWLRYDELERRRKCVPPFESRADLVEEALRRLTNLRELDITFTTCPYDIEVLQNVFEVPNYRKIDRCTARKNLNVIVAALQGTRLSSLRIDRLPMEILRLPYERKHWFDCRSGFASLASLDLTMDSSDLLPAGQFKAVNGLGCILHAAPGLKSLSLAFNNYTTPRSKFVLFFDEMLGQFAFEQLEDLRLEGVSCDESDLHDFLARHGATLRRLRLGGRGLAKPYEPSIGGVHLCRGRFRSLFAALRPRLVALERLHMHGDFECGVPDTSSHEKYCFHADTDKSWSCASRHDDSAAFERYLLHGGKYPKPV